MHRSRESGSFQPLAIFSSQTSPSLSESPTIVKYAGNAVHLSDLPDGLPNPPLGSESAIHTGDLG